MLGKSFCLDSNENIPNTVLTTFQKISKFSHSFPNVYQALKILITLPITSCECERSFSGMKKLKNCFRSTMGKERLDGLSLMYIHSEIAPDEEEVLDEFARQGPRRLEFI